MTLAIKGLMMIMMTVGLELQAERLLYRWGQSTSYTIVIGFRGLTVGLVTEGRKTTPQAKAEYAIHHSQRLSNCSHNSGGVTFV